LSSRDGVIKMSITMNENLKIRHLMAVIEAMEGTRIPFPTANKIFVIYSELKDFLESEEVEG